MQELSFEQVESVSGGHFVVQDFEIPHECIYKPITDFNQDFQLFIGRIVSGILGGIAGGLSAIMVHSGGSDEGAPLSVILAGAAAGAITGVVYPVRTVMESGKTFAVYMAGGASGNLIMQIVPE